MATTIEDQITLLLVEREGRPGTKGVLVELVRPAGLPGGLDGAPGAGEDRLPGPLAGMPTAMRFQLALLASVLAGDHNAARPPRQGELRDPGGALVEAAAAALRLSRWLDLALVQVARAMAERAGAQLLTRAGEVLRHRTSGGAVRRGAPPGQPDPARLIAEAIAAVNAPPPPPPVDPDAEPPSF